jgi:hypothetical protein
LWVAAGDGGANRFAYSSNGINWLPDLSGNGIFTTRCYTIATNGTIWVAGGSGTNQLVYSSDRITWTASTSGNAVITTQCTSVAWNGTTWVAAGSGTNTLAYSSNGMSWTAASSPFNNSAGSVVWDGTRWAAYGNGDAGVKGIAYSTDGITWVNSTRVNALLYGVAAMASTRVIYNNTITYSKPILQTTIGPGNLPATAFVGGGDGTNKLAYSLDGITWNGSASGNALIYSLCNTVAWNGTLWVAGGYGTGENSVNSSIVYSSDGITWARSTSANALFGEYSQCFAVAWSGTRWVAVGYGTNKLGYSSDGITWTASASGNALFTNTCVALAWNGTLWVAAGSGDNRLAYSSDGITWTADISGNAVFTDYCRAVAWNGTRWVAGGSGPNQLAYSSDGINWTASTNGNEVFTNYCSAVAWNGTRWVAGGFGTNRLAYSTDGIEWTASTSGNEVFTTVCTAVAWNGTRWVAGGSGTNQLAYSTDGITWTASTSGNGVFTNNCYAVASTRVLPSTSTTTPAVVTRYTALEGGTIPVNSLSATTPFLVESTYSPTTSTHYINGLTAMTNTLTPSHRQLTTNNLLGKTPWNKYMKGRIYEILVYNVEHTTLQRKFVEAYLLNKWRALAFAPTDTATPPSLWLDSSNTENLALSGTDITAWNDSSASGVNYASMFSQAHPQYSYDTVTKKYGVLFGSKGITSGLGNPTTSPFASTISQVSIFVVARFNNAFTTNTMYSTQTGNSPMRFTAKNGNPAPGATITATPANGLANTFTFTSSVITSPFVFSSISDGYYSRLLLNGAGAYGEVEGISLTNTTYLNFGYGVNSPLLSISKGYNGYIFEYLIYPYGVSISEQQKIEGYLAWKWGIQGSLPVTHPYYFSLP